MTETPNPNIVDTDSLTGEMHPIRRVVVALGSNLGERLSSLQGAVEALADVQLRMAVVESYSDTVREGVIFSVNPRQGATVPRGATVTVEVSLGPPTVIVPDVSSADGLDEASAMLEAAGLVPGDVSGPAKGKPDRTRPRAGEEVRRGSTVNIALK